MDTERRDPEPSETPSLSILSRGQLYALHACPACGAGVLDLELHRAWHERLVRVVLQSPEDRP